MHLRKATFKRMFKGKTQIPYKLSVRGQDYIMKLSMTWKYAFFEGAMKKLGQRVKGRVDVPDEFKANENTYNFLIKELEPTIKNVERTESVKLRGLKILTANISEENPPVFNRDGENIIFNVEIKGLCKYDGV